MSRAKTPKHTPGPWRLDIDTSKPVHEFSIRDGMNQQIASVNPYRVTWRDLDAARIVECVNACEGIENPAEIKNLLKALSSQFLSWAEAEPSLRKDVQVLREALDALGVK